MTLLTRKRGWLLALCCGISALLLPAQAQEGGGNALSACLDSLVRHGLPAGSNVSISVYDLSAGAPLYGYQADKLSRPASTMKLLTAVTALSQEGINEPFRTEVWYRGTVGQDTLHGDLYVVGGYDPEFDDAALDSLADAVCHLPFSVVEGRIYGDVSIKDSVYWGSGWLWDDNPSAFQPYLSPLMLEKGTVTVVVRPGAPGEKARVECRPASSYYTLTNRTRSRTPSAGGFRLSRDWMRNGNHLLVEGNVAGTQARTINLYSSQDFFMHTFADRLRERGIRCCHPGYAFGELRKDSLARRAGVYETPLQAVLDQMMKESDNLNAEALFHRLGQLASGKKCVSAKEGIRAMRRLIEQMGYDPSRYKLADGCGLSHYDYVSAELLVAFLRHAYAHTPVFQRLYKSLPVGGVDGTLEYRMGRGTPSHGNVHAKTGSYTGINCLAGYLKTAAGHWVAFAIMNQNVLSARQARAFQDAVCDAVISGGSRR